LRNRQKHVRSGLRVNSDGAQWEPARKRFIQCAPDWMEGLHVDGLGLGAVHGIGDFCVHHFLVESKGRAAAA
jgi:hypothetical protein